MLLNDKTIIITGASSGIGAQAAALFARNGAKLVLGARRHAELESLAKKIDPAGTRTAVLPGDVQHEDYARALVELAKDRFGGLDGAFNNAGILGALGPVPDMLAQDWQAVININLTSGFFAAKHQIPAMKERGGGTLVFTSSFVGHTIGMPGMGAYAAAKAGLIGLTQVLAVEHGTSNIRVNALLPGGTKTPMAGDDPQTHEAIRHLHALKRMASAEEIAQAALFLVSDQSSFVTGSAMLVDGGNSISKT